jgi:hypothetical protein
MLYDEILAKMNLYVKDGKLHSLQDSSKYPSYWSNPVQNPVQKPLQKPLQVKTKKLLFLNVDTRQFQSYPATNKLFGLIGK